MTGGILNVRITFLAAEPWSFFALVAAPRPKNNSNRSVVTEATLSKQLKVIKVHFTIVSLR